MAPNCSPTMVITGTSVFFSAWPKCTARLGRPRARAKAWARRLAVGTANVNEGFAAAWGSFDAPMGGWKASGVGRRHGREGIVKYTETQTVAVQRVMPIRAPHGVDAERWADLMSLGLKVLRYRPRNALLKATGGLPVRERR